jgi:hypothetical protein
MPPARPLDEIEVTHLEVEHLPVEHDTFIVM